MKQIPSVPMRTVPEGAIPQIMGFAACGMMQRMRMEERMQIKQEGGNNGEDEQNTDTVP